MRRRLPGRNATSRFVLALAVLLLPGCKVEQILIGNWYTIYTPKAGACPVLQWQFVVNAQRMIGGYLLTTTQQRIANLAGVLNPDDSFQMTATDVTGHRTANVTGEFLAGVSTISIHGDAAGAACDGQTFNLRLGGYFAFSGGGFGGN
jgi:hypothetical protein